MHGRLGHLSRIGSAVREARRAAGMTQLSLAISAEIGLAAVRGVESGIGRITSLNAILNALKLEIRGRNLMAGPIGLAMAVARNRRKLSRRGLARALNVSRNTLAAIEAGGGSMSELESYGAAVGAGLYLARVGEAKPFFANTGNSSGHHGWETPADLGVLLSEAVGGFDLDPCAGSTNSRLARVKARVLLTVNDDGLNAKWFGKVFCNPPYGRSLTRWISKCANEAERGSIVVGLIPCRPDTRWWHDYVRKADVFMIKGRLKFGDAQNSAPFASAIAVWGADSDLIARLLVALPDAWHVPMQLSKQVALA